MSYYATRGALAQIQGGFFSSLWSAVKTPVANVLQTSLGTFGTVARAALAHPVATAAAGAATATLTTAAMQHVGSAVPGTMPGGMHLTTGGTSVRLRKSGGGATVAMPGGRRRKRMNVCNPHALRRAIRRARGFEHLAMKVIGFSRPHKPKGHPYFKRTAKKRT